jgi:hypothetical protein
MSAASDSRTVWRTLVALAAVALLPIVGSWLLYVFWRPSAHVNYGDLVTGVALADAPTPAGLKDIAGKWAFLMVDSGSCDSYCQRKLYIMRQVRLTQGKNRERIERVWLVSDEANPPATLAAEYQGTRLLPAAGSAVLARLPASGSVRDHLYVLDPLGNLVLRYPRDPDPSLIKRDLSRLLRASRVG